MAAFAALVAAVSMISLEVPSNKQDGVCTPPSTLDGDVALDGHQAPQLRPFDWRAAPHAPAFLATGAEYGSPLGGWAKQWTSNSEQMLSQASWCPSPGTLEEALTGTRTVAPRVNTAASHVLLARVAAVEANVATPRQSAVQQPSVETVAHSSQAVARRLRAVARMVLAPRAQPAALSPDSAARERVMSRASVMALRMMLASSTALPPGGEPQQSISTNAGAVDNMLTASPMLPPRRGQDTPSRSVPVSIQAASTPTEVQCAYMMMTRSPAVFTRWSPDAEFGDTPGSGQPSPVGGLVAGITPGKLLARQRSFGTNVTNSKSPSPQALLAVR